MKGCDLMLDKYINKLAELSDSAILTPYNLLENLHLDNYVSVNFCKKNEYIVADIVFLDHNEEIKFRYVFDDNNFLQKIYHVNGNDLIEHFNRAKERKELISKLRSKHTFKKCI